MSDRLMVFIEKNRDSISEVQFYKNGKVKSIRFRKTDWNTAFIDRTVEYPYTFRGTSEEPFYTYDYELIDGPLER